MLERQGVSIPHTTLDGWKNRIHPDRWERIQREAYPQIAERMASQMEDLFQAEVELEWELIHKFREELPNLRASDVAGALRNIGVTKALNVDKAAPLRGRPNEVVAHRPLEDAENAIERLVRKGVLVEAEAVEVEEGEG